MNTNTKRIERKIQQNIQIGMPLLKNLSSEQYDLLIHCPSSVEREKERNDLAARILGFHDLDSCEIEAIPSNYGLMVLGLPVDNTSQNNDRLKALCEAHEILCKHFDLR